MPPDSIEKVSGWSLQRSNWEALAGLLSSYTGSFVKFLPAHAATLPAQPGVYVFCLKPKVDGPSFLPKLNNVIYVGQTVNLQSRYKQHLSGSTSVVEVIREFANLEFWYLLCSKEDLDHLEKRIYDVLNPLTNKVSPPSLKAKLGAGLPVNP